MAYNFPYIWINILFGKAGRECYIPKLDYDRKQIKKPMESFSPNKSHF